MRSDGKRVTVLSLGLQRWSSEPKIGADERKWIKLFRAVATGLDGSFIEQNGPFNRMEVNDKARMATNANSEAIELVEGRR